MADTIITNSPEGSGGDSGAGWLVALVVIIGLVVGGVMLYRNGVFNKQASPADTNINVTLPNPAPKPADSGTAN